MKKRFFIWMLSAFALFPSTLLAETKIEIPQQPAQDAFQKVQEQPQEIRELWSGALYTSTYKAGVCIDPAGKVRGVLLVRTMGGAVDPYHFSGSMEDGIFRASHGSGHTFKGSFASDDEVRGTITLKSGRNINLSGKRQRDVSLTDRCRPLPE